MKGSREKYGLGAELFGKTRSAVLALLYSNADRSFHHREIIRRVKTGSGAVQNELAHLTTTGLAVRRRVGNQVHYQANEASSIFAELKSLIHRTSGIAEILKEALSALSDRISIAFVYGSFAKGTETANSDIDVMIIGEATFSDVVVHLGETQDELGREINPSVYPVEEFVARLSGGHYFLSTVIDEPKIFLIGNQNDLEKLVEKWVADRA
jgi:uncharacterized protein